MDSPDLAKIRQLVAKVRRPAGAGELWAHTGDRHSHARRIFANCSSARQQQRNSPLPAREVKLRFLLACLADAPSPRLREAPRWHLTCYCLPPLPVSVRRRFSRPRNRQSFFSTDNSTWNEPVQRIARSLSHSARYSVVPHPLRTSGSRSSRRRHG